MGRPENMTRETVPRPAYKVNTTHPGSDVAGSTAAAFAAASIVFYETGRYFISVLQIFLHKCLFHVPLINKH